MPEDPQTSTGAMRSDGGTDENDDAVTNETRRMRRAITEIRREGLKVAVIYATVDAALVTLLANLALSLGRPSFVPARVPIPETVVDAMRRTAGLALADPTIAGGAVVGVALGAVVFVLEILLRVRRPLVEQFEAANPGLHESLRTARDALDDDGRSRIARRLYEDVLDELRRASSVGLLDLRRLAATVFVIAIVSLATIQLAFVDLSLAGIGGPGDGTSPTDRSRTSDGLHDPSSILGDPEDVGSGEENLDAEIDTEGSGSGAGSDGESAAAYDNSGFAGSDAYDSQRAGFTESERIEDAELIREYNLRIREDGE